VILTSGPKRIPESGYSPQAHSTWTKSLGPRSEALAAYNGLTIGVGRGTSLSGEITSCDRLITEGSVEANLQNCQHLEITETGVFNGNAAIDDVEVSGRFEGDLVVRKRLLIRASGQVSGTITYGEIEIEAGGRISDVIQAPEGPKGLRAIAASLRRGTTSGAGDGHPAEHD
jgi:cytoskeletal protein CcmA (bactofilin family)